MRAVLLAAGLGRRLEPLTHVVPKCLMPIMGVPLLEIWLNTLSRMGIQDVLINTHHLADAVTRFLHSRDFGVRLEIVFEPQLLGTGGTLLANAAFCRNHDVMLVHADNLSLFDPQQFLNCFKSRPSSCVGTMMTFETDAPTTCGIVELRADGTVMNMEEKPKQPKSHIANAAVYLFSASMMNEILDQSQTDLSTQILPRFWGRLNHFHNTTYHRDIGSVSLFKKALREILSLAPERLQNIHTRTWPDVAPSYAEWEQAWGETDMTDVILWRTVDESRWRAEAKSHPAITFVPWQVRRHA